MKILAVSDQESKFLWDYFDKNYVKDIDLILACGDLKSEYLTFLATMCKAPIVYVPGNHDKQYLTKPPEGCIEADDRLVTVGGLRILGFGGSMKYNGGPFQYTENQMKKRTSSMTFPILFHKGFDILLTHAPASGVGDGQDLAHHGFKAFNELMDRYHPPLMVHGHVHLNYGYQIKREETYGSTKVINAFDKYVFEFNK